MAMRMQCQNLRQDPCKGFVRITCSAGIAGINEVIDRIENRLNSVKK